MPPSAKSGMSGDFLTGKNILRRNICGPTDCLIPNSNPTHAAKSTAKWENNAMIDAWCGGFTDSDMQLLSSRLLVHFSCSFGPFWAKQRLTFQALDSSPFLFVAIYYFQMRSSQASPAGGELGALTERGGDRHQRDVEGDQQHPDWEGGNRHQKHEETIHVTWVSRSHAFT